MDAVTDSIEELLIKHESAPEAVAAAITERCALGRRKRGPGHPVEVPPVWWRPEAPTKRVPGEFNQTFKIGLNPREYRVFQAWAEWLGIPHSCPRNATTAVIREIARGRMALVPFESHEEYVGVLRVLKYVKETLGTLRKPVAATVAELIRSLSLLRRVKYLASKPSPVQLSHDEVAVSSEKS